MPRTDPDDRTVDHAPFESAATAPGAAESPPGAPPVIPGYEVQGLLGAGGMGLVYRARDLTLHRDLAVKVLKETLRGSPPARRRFLEEARVTGQLQHPGVPAVHELGELAD